MLRESDLGMQHLRRSTSTHILVEVSLETRGLLAGSCAAEKAESKPRNGRLSTVTYTLFELG